MRMLSLFAVFALLMLAGCGMTRSVIGPAGTPPEPGSPYVVEPGRDAATVAEMRAAPAPAAPEMQAGKNASGDRSRLAAQGFVQIGSARYPGDETQVREEALRQGQGVGADRVLLYAPATSGASTGAANGNVWIAAFFVRFKLPFGATFRDLNAEERTALGGVGGVKIGAIVDGTPASRANLLGGDIVVKFNGQPIAGKAEFQSLLKSAAGRSVTLTIVRNDETLQRGVRLGAMPSAEH